MKKLKSLSILLLISLAGCGTNDPQEWPAADSDCNYYEVDPIGNCRHAIGLCTQAGGLHCLYDYRLCPYQNEWEFKPNTCVKP